MYKHYIRINENNEVIGAFSNAFQEPLEGDILLRETEERHFQLNIFGDGLFRYTWDGKNIVEKKPEDLEKIKAKARRKAEIKQRLTDIDFKTARAGRRVAIGVASEEDLTYLRTFETEAEALREELKTL